MSGTVLEAWNFFEDLARGLGEVHRLPQQSALHNSAYEKLFGGEHAAWAADEQCAVLELRLRRLLPVLRRALDGDAVSVIACPVGYTENLCLTDRLGSLHGPF
ncbi:hypothetical protein [Streptomyces sp. NPDC005784]|uniref:hypothetical protein n=1 Tax=Streptomyces sp. NPDC005784 TaxID=3364731 RepID=UPI0036BD6801